MTLEERVEEYSLLIPQALRDTGQHGEGWTCHSLDGATRTVGPSEASVNAKSHFFLLSRLSLKIYQAVMISWGSSPSSHDPAKRRHCKHLSFVTGRRGFPPRLVPYGDFLSHAMTFSLLLFTKALLLVQVQCWAWEIMGVNNSSQKLPHSPREGKTQGSRCHQVPGLRLGHP